MMATAAAVRITSERRFFSGMALMMLVLVFAGFAPSFYLRGLVTVPRPNPSLTPVVLAHGAAFTVWMLVFWLQAALVSAGRVDLHRQLGRWGMVLGATTIPLMYLVTVGQVSRANGLPFVSPLAWTAVPLSVIVAFAPALWLGWRERRNGPAHKRLMLSAALMMMGPAVGRLPIVPPTLAGFAIGNALAWATYLPMFWWDRRTLGHIHWATGVGGALGALALVLPYPLMLSPAYPDMARHLPGI